MIGPALLQLDCKRAVHEPVPAMAAQTRNSLDSWGRGIARMYQAFCNNQQKLGRIRVDTSPPLRIDLISSVLPTLSGIGFPLSGWARPLTQRLQIQIGRGVCRSSAEEDLAHLLKCRDYRKITAWCFVSHAFSPYLPSVSTWSSFCTRLRALASR